jgi:hypothetical protein
MVADWETIWTRCLDVCDGRVGCQECEAGQGLHKGVPLQLQVEDAGDPGQKQSSLKCDCGTLKKKIDNAQNEGQRAW